MTWALHGLLRLIAAWWICAMAWVLPVLAESASLPKSPAPHYLLDEAGWLGPDTFSSLDATLQSYERESSSQVLVAVFQSLPADEELVDYCQRVYEAWKPGLKDKDNGAILFIFANDRKLRIHTGYGLEGVLPDARCKQIIEEAITPRLRDGQREAAVREGVRSIIAATKGEYQGTGETQASNDTEFPWQIVIFFIIFLLISIFGKSDDHGTVIISRGGSHHDSWGGGGGGSSSSGGGFSGGGGSSGGGGASGGW